MTRHIKPLPWEGFMFFLGMAVAEEIIYLG